MKEVRIKRTGEQSGIITLPCSKSYAHRYIIAAALSEKGGVVRNITRSKDIDATIGCLISLGADIEINDDIVNVKSGVKFNNAELNCNESASTLRFLIPVSIIKENKVKFSGSETLMHRPLDVYTDMFDKNGISYKRNGYFKLKGKLKSGVYEVDGSISSQFITGLLFSLPLLDGDSEIIIKNKLESAPYIDITMEVLKDFGIEIENQNYKKFIIKGNQKYHGGEFSVQGDYSNSAFFIASGILNGKVGVLGLRENSFQGDKAFIDICRKMGGKIYRKGDVLWSEKSDLHYNGEFDMSQCPDIVPILALVCCANRGEVVLKNTSRLKIKECDRGTATETMLNTLGGMVENHGEYIKISGTGYLNGGRVNSFNDHRMAMTAAVSAMISKKDIVLEDPMSVEKSYPEFYNDFYKTGGVEYEWCMGE